MTNLHNILEKELKNPEFKTEWDSLQPEKANLQALADTNNENINTHKTIKERFCDYKGNYRGEELDWGEDVGAEIIDW
jgi:hypothetical protein